MAFHSTSRGRSGGRDESPELLALKELFPDWTDEDLLFALQEAGGDVNLTTLRITEGHAVQWDEVKGKKKPQKSRNTGDRNDNRTNSQRGGFANRGPRGQGDGARGVRGTSARGTSRTQNGKDRQGRSEKDDYPALGGLKAVEKNGALNGTSNTLSWAGIAAATTKAPSDSSAKAVPTSTTADDSLSPSNGAVTVSNDTTTESKGTSIEPTTTTHSLNTPVLTPITTPDSEAPVTSTNATEPCDAPSPSNATAAPTRKINTTIPAVTRMSYAKVVKHEPAPQPVPAAPANSIPASASASASALGSGSTTENDTKLAESVVEPAPEPVSEPTLPVEEVPEEEIERSEAKEQESTVPELVEPEATTEPTPVGEAEERTLEPELEPNPKSVLESEPAPETKSAVEAPKESSPSCAAATSTPVNLLGQKPKPSQSRRLNQDAPVVMPGGTINSQSMSLKFGSFSLNSEPEPAEPEVQIEQPAQQPTEEPSASTPTVQPAQPIQPAVPTQPIEATQSTEATQPATPATPATPVTPVTPAQPTPPEQPAQSAQITQPMQQHPGTYGRPPNAGAPGYQGAAAGQSNTNSNTSYLKQDPASYPGHHHPGMGHDAMNSPYGSYMPSQLASFNMGPPMATLPNDYDLQRVYYDPSYVGQIPGTANAYPSRDGKYDSAAASTTSAAISSSTQAQQTLQQQQQQQQQPFPGMAGHYYPYYYMSPNQFPNAYQQSGYGQFMNKNMYPVYQQQQHSNKPGSANNSQYSSYNSTSAGQGGHHQYSQSVYEDMPGAGLHGMGSLSNDPYNKYNPGVQGFLGGQQQGSTPTTNAGSGKSNSGTNTYGGSDKSGAAGSQNSVVPGGASLQVQQGAGAVNQGQHAYYPQQMFSNYQYPNHQYPNHHQGYHPNQHQGQHHGSGRNNQQFWAQN